MLLEEQKRLLPYTEHMGLTMSERIEVINFVWQAMESIADQEWGINPTRHGRGQVQFYDLQDQNLPLDSELTQLTKEFRLH